MEDYKGYFISWVCHPNVLDGTNSSRPLPARLFAVLVRCHRRHAQSLRFPRSGLEAHSRRDIQRFESGLALSLFLFPVAGGNFLDKSVTRAE